MTGRELAAALLALPADQIDLPVTLMGSQFWEATSIAVEECNVSVPDEIGWVDVKMMAIALNTHYRRHKKAGPWFSAPRVLE